MRGLEAVGPVGDAVQRRWHGAPARTSVRPMVRTAVGLVSDQGPECLQDLERRREAERARRHPFAGGVPAPMTVRIRL